MRRHFALGIALALGCPGAALANALVVSSAGPSAPSYRVGARLAPGQQVRLAPGDRLSIIDKGTIRTLRGPGLYAVGAAGPAAQRSVLRSLVAQGGRRARPGAVRGPRGPSDLPPGAQRTNIWAVDVERDAIACHAPGRDVQLFRRRQGASEAFSLTDSAGALLGSFTLKPGAYTGSVRTARPLAAGGSYVLTGPGARRVALRAVALPAQASDEDAITALGAEFARNGCTGQFEALVRMLEAAPAEGAGH